jgi:RNA polymerase sigma factor (sigma-70 family)
MTEPADGSHSARATLSERILGSLPGLTRFVRRRMGPDLVARESASDIVQSTCRELLRGASRFEDQGDASFERWLRSAAEHKLQNRARHWRAQRRQGEARTIGPSSGAHGDDAGFDPEAPISSHPSQDALLREEAERLQRAFASLPTEYRVVLVRSQVDGASHGEIARELDKSPEAVRKLVARAMARLSAGLDTAPDADDDR